MAGLINIAYFRSFNPVAGQFRELDGIAAVIIGGGSIFGGYGTVIGALAGAAVITLVRALLQLNVEGFTMPQHWINVFIGGILIVAVLIDIWVRQANIFGDAARTSSCRREAHEHGSRPCLNPERRTHRRDAAHQQGVRRRAGARRCRPGALSRRDPRPGRRQFGRQVDADEDHDRRLSARHAATSSSPARRCTSAARTRAAIAASR